MADETINHLDEMGQWLLNNADKKGTPEFTEMADAYRHERSLSGGQTERRVWSNFAAAIPDTAISVANLAGRGIDYLTEKITGSRPAAVDLPHLGPAIRRTAGIDELPADASMTRRFLESTAATLPYAGLGAVSAASAAPTIGSALLRGGTNLVAGSAGTVAGSEVGSRIGGAIGGETGAEVGGLLGGAAVAGAPSAARTIIARNYRGAAQPNAPEIVAAANRQNVPLTPEMIGNQAVRNRVIGLESKPGAGEYIGAQRVAARDAATQAALAAANRRGAVSENAAVTGDTITQMVRDATEGLQQRTGAAQQGLMDRIGPRAEVDTTPILAQLMQIKRQTDPNTFGPIRQRSEAIKEMLLDRYGDPPTSANLPYEQVKDWRTNLRQRSQGLDPVPGRYQGQVYDAATGVMEDTAANSGVPRPVFRDVQQRTRAIEGPGGTVERLGEIPTEPQAAYNYVLRGGERNPQRLENFSVPTMGDPRLGNVMGDYMRQLTQDTLGKNAPGAGNFAERVQGTHPRSRDMIYAGERPTMEDLATLAQAMHRQTSQGGTTRMVRGAVQGGAAPAIGAGAGALAHGALPAWLTAAMGYVGPRYINRARAGVPSGETAMRSMQGLPTRTIDMNQLAAALAAAEAERQNRRQQP